MKPAKHTVKRKELVFWIVGVSMGEKYARLSNACFNAAASVSKTVNSHLGEILNRTASCLIDVST